MYIYLRRWKLQEKVKDLENRVKSNIVIGESKGEHGPKAKYKEVITENFSEMKKTII